MIERIVLCPKGPEVSRFAFGAWRLLKDEGGSGPEVVLSKIQACLELGITTFDHADVYGAYTVEECFGAALAKQPKLRERLELVSKCGIQAPAPARPETRTKHYDFSRAHIVRCAERSLSNLRTDRLDVLLLHRPSPVMDPDEIAAAFSQLRQAGKVLHLGVSNFSPAQFDLVQSRLEFPLVTNQIEASLLHTAPFFDGSLDHLTTHKVKPMIWSPTGGGRLFKPEDPQAARVRAVLDPMAQRYGVAPDQLAYAWLLAHPSKMLIVLGTNRIDRVRTAVAGATIQLDLQDWFALLAASRGQDVP